jgi:hypothetical protein
MSIDERLRAGLHANTAVLTPAVEEELASLGHRLHRRRQARIAVCAVVAVSAVAAAALLAPGTVQSLRGTTVPSHRTSSPAPTPTPMSRLTPGSAIPPGTYSGTFDTSPRPAALPRAVVRVPPGYVADGSGELAADTEVSGQGLRHLALWWVSEVISDPCSASAVWRDPGPTARDLADALAALPVWESTTPRPVTIGGYDGLVMDFDVPDPIPVRCGGMLYHWLDDIGGSQGLGPGKRQRLWILDVAGQRVVILAGWFPRGVSDPDAGTTPAQARELVRMAEGITFLAPQVASR